MKDMIRQLWLEYLDLEKTGLRAEALVKLRRFISEMGASPQLERQAWTTSVLHRLLDKGESIPVRHPLLFTLLLPDALHRYRNRLTYSARWMGGLFKMFEHTPGFLDALNEQERHELPIIAAAVHDDPNNQEQKAQILRDWFVHLENATMSEAPRAVMWWPNAATAEQCERLIAEIDDFAAMAYSRNRLDEHDAQIASWRHHATCYRDFLLAREKYATFEEYLSKHPPPQS